MRWNPPVQKYLDLCELDLASGKSERPWESSGKLAHVLASRDHQRFIAVETLSDSNTNLWLFERGKREGTLLTPHQPRWRILLDPL